MDLDRCDFDGACHCGAVRFRVRLAQGLHTARRCNCSYCRMRGAVIVTARLADLEVTQGAQHLGVYRFGTHVAAHHFCRICGIATHQRRRSDPTQFGVNVACLGLSPFDFPELPVNESANWEKGGVAGYLSYRAAE